MLQPQNCVKKKNPFRKSRAKSMNYIEVSGLQTDCLLESAERHVGFYSTNNISVSHMVAIDPEAFTIEESETPVAAEIYPHCALVYKDSDTIAICGGVTAMNNAIKRCFQYTISKKYWGHLPPMIAERCSFAIFYENSKIYAVGGLVGDRDQQTPTRHCEVYDYTVGEWHAIARLNCARFNGALFGYKDDIWLIDGISLNSALCQLERYIKSKNTWEIIKLDICPGFMRPVVMASHRPDEILLLDKDKGFASPMIRFNLVDHTYIAERYTDDFGDFLHSIKLDDRRVLLVFLNEKKLMFCVYDEVEGSLLASTGQMKQIERDDAWFGWPVRSIAIVFEGTPYFPYPSREYRKINLIFGTYYKPFQLEINSKTGHVDVFPIKTNFGSQIGYSMCRTASNELFMCENMVEPDSTFYGPLQLYNLNTRTAKELPEPPYLIHRPVYYYRDGYVYNVSDNIVMPPDQMYTRTQRLNLSTLKWEYTKPISSSITGLKFIEHSGHLYMAGQMLADKSTAIMVFSDKRRRWEICTNFKGTFLIFDPFVYETEDLVLRRETTNGMEMYSYNINNGDLAGLVPFDCDIPDISVDPQYICVGDKHLGLDCKSPDHVVLKVLNGALKDKEGAPSIGMPKLSCAIEAISAKLTPYIFPKKKHDTCAFFSNRNYMM